MKTAMMVAAATFALGIHQAAACETAEKVVQPIHLTTTALEIVPAAAENTVDLPSIESLTADSDFTILMRAGVPKDVQTAALRKLWRLNPAFSRSDGLDSDMVDWLP